MPGGSPPLPIAIIPLTKDGCVDTEVDIEEALRVVALGCEPKCSVPERAAASAPAGRFFRTLRGRAHSGALSPGMKNLCS